MELNRIISKIPRPILVLAILLVALVLFVYNDPLRDECEVQSELFNKKMQGILSGVKVKNPFTGKKNIQYPKINFARDKCREGNTVGSCSDYISLLKTLVNEFNLMSDKCQIKYSLENEGFLKHISNAIQILALVAWGDKPPSGLAERPGWLSVADLKVFCNLKRNFISVAGEENYLALREKVFREYPNNWPEDLEVENRIPENRPRAYKTESNPKGTMKFEDIFSRSLFSIKCESYM